MTAKRRKKHLPCRPNQDSDMFTTVLSNLSLLTLIHVGSLCYQNKWDFKNVVLWEELEAAQGTCSLSSLQEALASPCSPQKSLVLSGRGTDSVLSPCLYSEHRSLQGLFAVPETDVGMTFPTKSYSPNQYCKYLLPSLLHTAALPESLGKQRATTGFYEALHEQQV